MTKTSALGATLDRTDHIVAASSPDVPALPRTLPVMGSSAAGAANSWQIFLARRADLCAQMELSVCDGCDQCGLRCTDGFLVTRAEHDTAMAAFNDLPTSEQGRLLRQNRTVFWPGAADDMETLGGAGDAANLPTVTYCRFRDMEKNRCSIYAARATICRLFGHTRWLPCPVGAVTKTPAGDAALWNDYRRFERRTWEDWEIFYAAEGKAQGGAEE